MVMSGTPRALPTTLATPFWYQGRANTDDTPPPESFHKVSGEVRSPAALRCSWVPPTAVTRGSLAGQLTTRWV